MIAKYFMVVCGIIGLVFILSVLLAWPTMYLWNWLMTSIFHLREITFWEALGLCLLCNILIKGSSSSSSKS